jgi:hypothetical protein
MFNTESLQKKWAPVLDHKDAPKFKDNHRKAVTAALLENTEKALAAERAATGFLTEAQGNAASAATNFDPILISLVRRAMPNLIAYDIAGVQPMSGPTGLIFAMKSQYQLPSGGNSNGTEAFYADGTNPIRTAFSGSVTTAQGEALTGNSAASTGVTTAGGGFGNMGFTIEKTGVTAKTRALKADYTMELAQDLKAVHGLDAESELANILSTEILAEINREVIDTVNAKAKVGALGPTVTDGTFDLVADADGRWAVEKFKSLIFQIEIESNEIAKSTRRGKGNFIVCSSNVASALTAAGMLDYTPALSADLQVDDTGNTFAGVLNGRIKVYVDPYAVTDYVTVGYRGTSAYDAGLFYCPYVPLTMVRAVDDQTFQPRIGFKTRYGMVANPYVTGVSLGSGVTDGGLGTNAANQYFRKFTVTNLNVGLQS